jgi:hypothetical protein
MIPNSPKRLFYEKLDEYESKLPQKYDREKFVLSSEKYNLILECLNTEKGIKANTASSPPDMNISVYYT